MKKIIIGILIGGSLVYLFFVGSLYKMSYEFNIKQNLEGDNDCREWEATGFTYGYYDKETKFKINFWRFIPYEVSGYVASKCDF